MIKFEELKIGDKAEIRHQITLADIQKFVSLTGDDNKLHLDEAFAKNTSFKKPVAHGMLSASFISTIIGTKLPGDGALWYAQSLEFLMPVRIGDEITVVAELISKDDNAQTVELQTDIFNQHKQKVVTGKAKVKVVSHIETLEEKGKRVKEKLAVIIGATGGIGSATCLKLAEAGFNIAIHYYRNKAKAEELRQFSREKGRESFCFQNDLNDFSSVQEFVNGIESRLGPISVLVNCAALPIPTIKLADLDWQDFDNQLRLHLQLNFYLAQALVPSMQRSGSGKMVFISSQVSDGAPPAGWMHYTVAKYALNGLAKSLAIELAPRNITVNVVSPGMTETDLIASISERSRLLAAAKTPLKRLARAEEIAGAISFLCSEEADYITGETIRINGGQIMI